MRKTQEIFDLVILNGYYSHYKDYEGDIEDLGINLNFFMDWKNRDNILDKLREEYIA